VVINASIEQARVGDVHYRRPALGRRVVGRAHRAIAAIGIGISAASGKRLAVIMPCTR
jgi:hypothetical protein